MKCKTLSDVSLAKGLTFSKTVLTNEQMQTNVRLISGIQDDLQNNICFDVKDFFEVDSQLTKVFVELENLAKIMNRGDLQN